MAMRIFLSAGEASGDAYGAALVRALRDRGYSGSFEGAGGPRMAAEGVEMLADTSRFGAMSIGHSLPQLPYGLASYYRAKHRLAQGERGIIVPIDFGAVNIRLIRYAKRIGWRVLYFVPPGSWRRDRQGKDLPILTDRIVTPFSWSAEILAAMGADVRWFGHPIKSLLRGGTVSPPDRPTLAVLPGSRAHELKNNLPILARALRDWPHALEFGLSTGADTEAIRAQWPRSHDLFTVGDARGVLRRAHAAVVCSGTATLESTLLRVPTVVFYEADDRMRREAATLERLGLFRRPEFYSLPNILLQRRAVPELVDRVDPAALRASVEAIWTEGPERAAQLADFEELDRLLGPDDAIDRTADWILDWPATETSANRPKNR